MTNRSDALGPKLCRALVFISILGVSKLLAEVILPFDIRYQANINGNIVYTGNTLMKPEGITDPPLDMNNDRANMVYVNVDGNPATNKSSRALLDIQEDSDIVFAALYWGGRLNNLELGRTAWLQVPGQAYEEVTAEWIESPERNNYYAAYADVTDLVRAGGRGHYTVGNVAAQPGLDRFAGWSLVVIEANDRFPFRNITLFDGYASIPEQVDIVVEGFTAPRHGTFNASLGVVVYEGDAGHDGAQFLLNGEPLYDDVNPPNNFFNSRFTRYGKDFTDREPAALNLTGFDIAQVDITGWLENGDTSAKLSFRTDRDWYQPTAVSLMTDFNIDVSMQSRLHYEGVLTPQDRLVVETAIENRGEQSYEEVEVLLPIPDRFSYSPQSTSLDWIPLSDEEDSDYAVLTGEGVRVSLPAIRSGERRVLRYELVAKEGFDAPLSLQPRATLIVPELNSRALVLSDADTDRPGPQPIWVYPLSLKAPASVQEGGAFEYRLSADATQKSDLQIRLHDGSVLDMAADQSVLTHSVLAPENSVYTTSITITNHIEKIVSQGAAYPIVLQGSHRSPVEVVVEDVVDVTTLKLEAEDVLEGDPGVLVRARLSNPTRDELLVTLDGGESLRFLPGGREARVLIPVRDEDVYLSAERLRRTVASAEGGGFEELDTSAALIDVLVDDTQTPVYLSLQASSSVYEGGQIEYTARVSHPPQTPLSLTLESGESLVIEPGQTRASLVVPAPENSVYLQARTLSNRIVKTEGGNYENLIGAQGGEALRVRTSLKDVIDTVDVQLAAGDVKETDGHMRFTAILGAPAQTPARLYLDGGEVIEIAAGSQSGYVDLPIAPNNVYISEYTVERTIKRIEGGNFESLDYHGVGAAAQVLDVIDPVHLTLSADPRIKEGQKVTYVAELTHPPRTELTLTLSNGASLTVLAGQKRGQSSMVIAENTPYKSAHELAVYVTGMSGGGFEKLVVDQGSSESPVITAVEDEIDVTTLSLMSADVSENDENLVFTATLSNPAQSPVVVALDGGEQIHILPGHRSGFVTVAKREPDVYISEDTVSRKVVSFEGGNFESVDYTQASAQALVYDVVDTTTLELSADTTVKEGGVITFKAQVDYPPQSDLVLSLDNGVDIVIEAGELEATARVDAPENIPYRSAQTLEVALKESRGGNYERLEVATGGQESPLRIRVQDEIDITTLHLDAEDVNEGDEGMRFVLTLSHPAQTPATILLDGGEEIVLQPGEDRAEVLVAVRPNDVYLSESQIERRVVRIEGGNYEQVEISNAHASAKVRDVVDTVELVLRADEKVDEGTGITYRLEAKHPPRGDLRAVLSSGHVMTLPDGHKSAQLVVNAPANTPYKSAHDQRVWIRSVSGGEYEDLKVVNADSQSAALTRIEDVIDTVWVELFARDTPEGAEGMPFIARLSAPAQTPVTLTLDGGEQITIDSGDTAGSTLVAVRDNDVYAHPEQIERRVVAIKGGNFESTDLSGAFSSALVYDTLDPVTLALEAPQTVQEGGVIRYRASLSHPPRSPLLVRLDSGHEMRIEPGQKSAVLELNAPADTVYVQEREVTTFVKRIEGGGFENLQLTSASAHTPLRTQVVDVPTPVELTLKAHGALEGESMWLEASLDAPALTPATVYLENNRTIPIAAGSRSGSIQVELRPDDPYLADGVEVFRVSGFEGGGFEEVLFDGVFAKAAVGSTITRTTLHLSGPKEVASGGEIIYRITLGEPTVMGATVLLSNQERIAVRSGQQEASISVPVPKGAKPGDEIVVAIAEVSGGGYERIVLQGGLASDPVVTVVK